MPGGRKLRGWALALALILPAPAAHAGGRILVLTDKDVAAYARAFEAADKGDWKAARKALDKVEDETLAGHVEARTFLSRRADPRFSALKGWLEDNRDNPYFPLIRDKARKERPRAKLPQAETGRRRPFPMAGSTPPGDSAALRTSLETALQRFASGDLDGAQAIALSHRAGPRAGPANWQLGLIAFRQQRFADAAAAFDAAIAWPHWDAWGASAARYWAGRAHLAAGEPKPALARFKAALAYPATFYGQIAEAQLGLSSGLAFTPPALEADAALAFMRHHPEARRAAALAQLDRLSDVEAELRVLHARLNPGEDRTYLDFADALAAPSAQLRAAEYGGPEEGWGYCPTTSFAPDDGFRLDRAALLAVTRQESRYSPVAVSSSNARGLMQLLPSTAQDMDKSTPYRAKPDLLHEPGLNMRLGQAYLEWLQEIVAKDGDLGKIFAAYNGGPGWLSRWLAANPDLTDPLLIIESLPRAESRDYAERVLAHMGLCRKRFGQESVEFDALAGGEPARYVALDR